MNNRLFHLFIKLFVFCACSVLLFSSCETKKQKLQAEYRELVRTFHQRFSDDSSSIIYNPNKEYLIDFCLGIEGWGLQITDLSKWSLESKVQRLRIESGGEPAERYDYGWLNDYIHEAIDNYTKYGEEFLLIWPSGQRNPTPPQEIRRLL